MGAIASVFSEKRLHRGHLGVTYERGREGVPPPVVAGNSPQMSGREWQ